MASKRSDLLANLKTLLVAQLSWAKVVAWEQVRLLSSDFQDHELPCVQFYHVRTDYEQQQGRVQARMMFNVELCMKSNASAAVDQQDLFDKMDDILKAVGTNPNLGIPGMIHLRLLSDETDTHTIVPHYLGILAFEATYLTTFTGC
jgi:hypothetical protein